MSTEITAPVPVNYRSEFDLFLRLRDKAGNDLGWPSFDWRAEFYTWSPAAAFTASCIGGVCTNCREDNGRIRVIFDNHHLTHGRLHVRFTAELPDSDYPDGLRRHVVPATLAVELVKGPATCQCPQTVEADIYLSVLRDSDVADAILRVVNEQLALILGRGPADFRPATAPATAAQGAAPVLQGGIMPLGAAKGSIYRRDYVKLTRLKEGKVYDLNEAFPDGIDGDIAIRADGVDVTYDPAKNTITVLNMGEQEGTCSVNIIVPGKPGFITKDSDGRIVPYETGAGVPQYPEAVLPSILSILGPTWDMDDIRQYFCPGGKAGSERWAYGLFPLSTDSSILVELQVRKRLRAGRGKREKKTRWRRVEKLPKCGVFRIRAHTRSGRRSPWQYYTIHDTPCLLKRI